MYTHLTAKRPTRQQCVHSLGINLVDGFGGGRGDRGVVESQEAAEDVSVLAG